MFPFKANIYIDKKNINLLNPLQQSYDSFIFLKFINLCIENVNKAKISQIFNFEVLDFETTLSLIKVLF